MSFIILHPPVCSIQNPVCSHQSGLFVSIFIEVYFEGERIPSRLPTVRAESGVGLELTNHEIMTQA